CIEAVVSSPPRAGETVQVVNEIAQTMQIKELAAMFAGVANVPIEHIETPRSEPVENELIASNERLRAFGITPTLISEESISQLIATVRPHIGEASLDHLYPKGAAIPVSKPAI
ncbi:MAG: hypothetical protein AAFQ67_02585, partial [Pseudomonadota bacterium]